MNQNNKPMLPDAEKGALLRECFAIDWLPDDTVRDWMEEQRFDFDLHARLGSVMGLAPDTPVPSWAEHRGTPWPQAGRRLLAPLCDADGKMRSFVAQSVTGAGASVPTGYSTDGLIVACPTARGGLAGNVNPSTILITDSFLSWLREVENAQQCVATVAVWGLLQDSWTPALLSKIPADCTVTLVREPNTRESDRLLHARNALQPRIANGDIELKQWPPAFRSA